jgi:hypothetical protein
LADRLHLPRLDRSDTRIPTLGGQADVRTFLNVSMNTLKMKSSSFLRATDVRAIDPDWRIAMLAG